ncbi:MAG: zinc ribbon domain-containing protein [Anaerovibrio sp.]|uniref:zinc ribbon domain-containing protein n=1 Tax=Anaerovibrio sp. TaxID=1872532 RepID=UPI0025DFFF58|nr:zinc ribbon domain-containing protein [Anaerovibrio sp.]MCR5175471.1 zinc ribbon domain-containing protein [Anaerovibrio sp.]
MPFCHNCGAKCDSDSKFCSVCGTKLMDLNGRNQAGTANSVNYIAIDNMKNMLGFWQPLPDYRSVLNQFQTQPDITGEKEMADKLMTIAKHYQEIDKLRTSIGGVNVGMGAGLAGGAVPQGVQGQPVQQGYGNGYGGAMLAGAGGAMVGMAVGHAMAGNNTAYAAQPGAQPPPVAPAPAPAPADGGGGFFFVSGDAVNNVTDNISSAGSAVVDTVSSAADTAADTVADAASDLADAGSEVADGASSFVEDLLDLF